MTRYTDPLIFNRIWYLAIEQGVLPHSPISLKWDVSGRCSDPHVLQLKSGVRTDDIRIVSTHIRRYIELSVPCRKCENCMKRRAWEWLQRAKVEHSKGTRTWFLTLTVAPEHRTRFKILARQKKGNEDYPALCTQVGEDLKKMLKRLRKQHNFKQLFVFEPHSDMFPHIHGLLHEQGPRIGKREIQNEWKLGFSQVKLVDEKALWYVTKYLTKHAGARVRASRRYGKSAILDDKAINDILSLVLYTTSNQKPFFVGTEHGNEGSQISGNEKGSPELPQDK